MSLLAFTLRTALIQLRRGEQRVLVALLCIAFGVMSLVSMSLLGVGSRFVGTVEGCAALLDRIVAGEDPARLVEEHREARRSVPGFGHPLYPAGDPRAPPIPEFD